MNHDRRGELREELAPFIGERVVSLLEQTLAGELAETPDVTEAEALLLDWARSGGVLDDESQERFERTFTPRLRELLGEFVAA
ncbi:MAG: hypothetical protein KKH51_07610 [Actinobacteria bacterium]|nr:hypothetical protein [Actinomycetota bacterium]